MACSPHFTVSNMIKAAPELGYKKGISFEFAVAQHVENLGHIVFGGPSHVFKFEHGFDVMSYDPKTDTVHLWEAKDWTSIVHLSDLYTFESAWGDDEKRKEKVFSDRLSTGLLAQFPKESPARNVINNCLKGGRLHFNLVGSSTTKFDKKIFDMATRNS